MKNTTVAAQIVVGRNADVVLKMVDFDVDYTLLFNTALAEIKEGKSVGIVARNPVNKKEHITEVEVLIAALNNKITEESVPTMTTVQTIQARINEVSASLKEVEMARESIRSLEKYNINVARYNALSKELDQLNRDLYKAQAETGIHLINPADMTEAERKETEVIARWKNRNTGSAVLDIHGGAIDYSKRAKNPAFKLIGDGYDAVMQNVMASQKSFNITVHQIVPYPKKDRQDRIGYIIFQVPAGLLDVKQWNGQRFVFTPMDNYDYNGFNSSRARLTFGSGFLKLAIKENAEGVFISWPKSRGKDGEFYDVFTTADVRFDWKNTDNNYNVQSALTAFVRTFWGEFVQANPKNRHGFNEHCGNCRHMVYLPIHDQMGEDYENKANPVDTSELGQWGSRIPQWICSVHKEFVDAEAIDELNESQSYEGNTYYDAEGQLRFLRANEVLIKGKPVAIYNVRAESTSYKCAECPFYAKNERKPEQTITKEKEAVNGGFVPKYWTDRARAERMPVFTQHVMNGVTRWDLGFPGHFEAPTQFCVQGIGGINVYGTAEIMEIMPKAFVPAVEEYKEEEAAVAKLINIVHQVCNQFVNIQPETLGNLTAMIQATPAPTKQPLLARYQRAMGRLVTLIQQNQQ